MSVSTALRFIISPLLVATLSACAVSPCDEFAAPQDRAPSHCPAKERPADPAPPKGEASGTTTRYCYATLGDVDCYPVAQAGHPGYLGAYAPGTAPSGAADQKDKPQR